MATRESRASEKPDERMATIAMAAPRPAKRLDSAAATLLTQPLAGRARRCRALPEGPVRWPAARVSGDENIEGAEARACRPIPSDRKIVICYAVAPPAPNVLVVQLKFTVGRANVLSCVHVRYTSAFPSRDQLNNATQARVSCSHARSLLWSL